MPLKANWADLGSWDAVWKISKKDENKNFIEGNIITKNTKQLVIFKSEKRLIAAIGVKDLIVIETSDAILVADKNKSQEVKNIVEIKGERKKRT